MQQAVDGLTRLLDTMVEIARLDAGIVAANSEAIGLNPILQRLNDDCAGRAKSRGLDLSISCERPSTPIPTPHWSNARCAS